MQSGKDNEDAVEFEDMPQVDSWDGALSIKMKNIYVNQCRVGRSSERFYEGNKNTVKLERICAMTKIVLEMLFNPLSLLCTTLIGLVHSHVGRCRGEMLERSLLSHVHSLLLVCFAVHVLHLSGRRRRRRTAADSGNSSGHVVVPHVCVVSMHQCLVLRGDRRSEVPMRNSSQLRRLLRCGEAHFPIVRLGLDGSLHRRCATGIVSQRSLAVEEVLHDLGDPREVSRSILAGNHCRGLVQLLGQCNKCH